MSLKELGILSQVAPVNIEIKEIPMDAPFKLTLEAIVRLKKSRENNPPPAAPRFTMAKQRDPKVPGGWSMKFIDLGTNEDVPVLDEELPPFDVDAACKDALQRIQCVIDSASYSARAVLTLDVLDAQKRLGLKDNPVYWRL